MIYMAGDAGVVFRGPITGEALFANLAGPLAEDLAKIRAGGASEQVAVCVQFDSLDAGQAFRWIVPAAGEEAGDGPQPVGAVNTGDPNSLSDFVRWAGQERPAERYALALWGHGSGWDETDLYARFPEAQKAESTSRSTRKKRLIARGVFASTAAQIMQIPDAEVRGLCYDDTARDFLDNAELQRALADAARRLGRDKIDVLGLDACLMSMVEVAYQLRGEVSYLVAAETVLPTDHWAWTEILQDLHARPGMTPKELAASLAARPPERAEVRGIGALAQAALDLSQVEGAVCALNDWSAELVAAFGDFQVKDAVQRARGKGSHSVLRLKQNGIDDTDYVDLVDFVRRFAREYHFEKDVDAFLASCAAGDGGAADVEARLRPLTAGVLKAFHRRGDGQLVLDMQVEGFNTQGQPGGLSIYLPDLDDRSRDIHEISPQYGNLDFADGAWPELICKQFKQALPEAFLDFRRKRREAP
jgi:hypothetical protein